jgi:recombination protein RecT
MTNQVSATQNTSIKAFFNQPNIKQKFEELLGKRSTQFITSVLQIAASNDMLKNADPVSIFNAAAVAATLDLPLNNAIGFAYIVPFNSKQKDGSYKVLAQFQIGTKGLVQLALRSGQFLSINTSEVRDGEIISYDRLSGTINFNWIQDDKERLSKKVVGYVSYFKLINGFESTYYMTVEQLEQHGKKYSQTFKKGFGLWKDDFNAMALKTVLKLNLAKNAPLSVEMITAVKLDQAVIKDPDTEDVDYVDATPKASEQVQKADINKEEERASMMIANCKTIDELNEVKKNLPAEYESMIQKRGAEIIDEEEN